MVKFAQLNCLATLAAIIVFAVCIAAVTVDWYEYNQQFSITNGSTDASGAASTTTFNSTDVTWNMQGVTRMIHPTGQTPTNTFTLHDPSTSVWSTFKLMQAFVLIALITAGLLTFFLILCFACAIRNQLLFTLGMNVLRIALLAISALILVSLVIAFLGFLGITNSFASDTVGCNFGYCHRFQDSTKATIGTGTVGGVTGTITEQTTFGPIQGWYLVLGCIPVAIVLTIIVVINKFPIPVDSVTIGEAL